MYNLTSFGPSIRITLVGNALAVVLAHMLCSPEHRFSHVRTRDTASCDPVSPEMGCAISRSDQGLDWSEAVNDSQIILVGMELTWAE